MEKLEEIKLFLQSNTIICSNINEDGRINSTFDEKIILDLLINEYPDEIEIPQIRMWYDFLIEYDGKKLPVNIKSTTTKTCDNIGNLATCLWAYTNYPMDIYSKYQNGKVSELLITCFKEQMYNDEGRDYYFLVIDKITCEIIVNSMLGLESISGNINNLPFQVKWKNNKIYSYKEPAERIKEFITMIKKTKSWKESFLSEMRLLD